MNSDKIVGVTGCLLNIYYLFISFKKKVAMIPLGADNEPFSFDQNKRELLERPNIPYDNIVIVYTES